MIRHYALALVMGVWVVGGCAGAAPDRRGVVRPGIDILLTDSLHLVRGRRVGLVTNQTGVDQRGVSSVDRLRDAGVSLSALYSPEHGFRGGAAPGAAVGSSTDSATGLPIYSLYGATRVPTPAMLAGIEVLLIDLQDVGARYYTYISTALEVMRVAGRAGITVVVLDRPNPIGGTVQGNVLDPAARSFVGALEVPMRHGLTLGEMALLGVRDEGMTVDLRVVPVAGWHRRLYFDETGLPLVPPSPNLRTLESMLHYPGLCLFEGTNLSVGRGTNHPFAQVGAPWLDAARVHEALGAQPGVSVEVVSFTPRAPGDGKYGDTLVAGLRFRVVDRDRYDPTAVAVALLAAVRATHPDRFAFLPAHFDRLAGGPALREALEAGRPSADIVAGWARAPGIADFRTRRTPVVLYPE